MEFEWDRDKAKSNAKKHSVPFDEAITVFNDPAAYTFHAPDHSLDEDRYLVFGYSKRNRLLTVVYTYRERKTRIISARRATAGEQEIYAEV